MGNTIGQSEVSDLPETKPYHRLGALSRCRGVTLIELSFVIGIIAIIVVAALAVYNAVRNSQDLTTAVSDVSAIRTAVSNWAGNEPIFAGANPAPDTPLTNAIQIHTLLPGKLREAARTNQTLTLQFVNPWQGNYIIDNANNAEGQIDRSGQTPDYSNNPFVFMVQITEIPLSQHEPLRRRLEEGAESISGAVTAAETGTESLTVVYRI